MTANIVDQYAALLHQSLSERATADLLEIYQHGNLDDWDESVFEVVRQILTERAVSIPVPSVYVQVADLVREAAYLLDAEDWSGLLDRTNRIVELLPEYVDGYTLRSRALNELDQLDQALLNLQTSLHLNPNQPEVLDEWVAVMEDLSLQDEDRTAECDFEQTPAREHLDLALDLIHEDQTEEALAEIEIALACLPEIALAHNYLGLIYEEMDRVEPAMEAYRTAIHCNPRFFAARQNLANARIRWEAEQYRLAAQMEPAEEELPEYTAEDWLAESPVGADNQLPEWFYLDETAFWLRGWPGNRNRSGRIGLDPLDYDFELAHMEGVVLRKLLTGRFRTHDAFDFLLMMLLGMYFLLPFVFFLGDVQDKMLVALISVVSFYPISGILIFINLIRPFISNPTDEEQENGRLFY
jgi:tetratricopeptide (TPR) repeat protein